MENHRKSLHVILSLVVFISGFLSSLPENSWAKHSSDLSINLPPAGTMVTLSPQYEPITIKGLTVVKNDPFRFDFIMTTGDDNKLQGEALKLEGEKLIRYFLASLAVPEQDLWVNLSPYEGSRVVPPALGDTELGRDMLAQDYILKQLTASLIYPEKELGKKFWDKVYAQMQAQYGKTVNIPVNTFNKVWIMADQAEVFEKDQTVMVTKSRLKVMLEEDYLAATRHEASGPAWAASVSSSHHPSPGGVANLKSTFPLVLRSKQSVTFGNTRYEGAAQSPDAGKTDTQEVIRQIILPEIEKEVNEGKNFASLRQIFNAIILAKWFKENLRDSIISQIYGDKSKVKGIEVQDKEIAQKIYEQYVRAYKKGVFNYIKVEKGDERLSSVPRKYFSGGVVGRVTITRISEIDAGTASSLKDHAMVFSTVLNLASGVNPPAYKIVPMVSDKADMAGLWKDLNDPAKVQIRMDQHRINFVTRHGTLSFVGEYFKDKPDALQKIRYAKQVYLSVLSFRDMSEIEAVIPALSVIEKRAVLSWIDSKFTSAGTPVSDKLGRIRDIIYGNEEDMAMTAGAFITAFTGRNGSGDRTIMINVLNELSKPPFVRVPKTILGEYDIYPVNDYVLMRVSKDAQKGKMNCVFEVDQGEIGSIEMVVDQSWYEAHSFADMIMLMKELAQHYLSDLALVMSGYVGVRADDIRVVGNVYFSNLQNDWDDGVEIIKDLQMLGWFMEQGAVPKFAFDRRKTRVDIDYGEGLPVLTFESREVNGKKVLDKVMYKKAGDDVPVLMVLVGRDGGKLPWVKKSVMNALAEFRRSLILYMLKRYPEQSRVILHLMSSKDRESLESTNSHLLGDYGYALYKVEEDYMRLPIASTITAGTEHHPPARILTFPGVYSPDYVRAGLEVASYLAHPNAIRYSKTDPEFIYPPAGLSLYAGYFSRISKAQKIILEEIERAFRQEGLVLYSRPIDHFGLERERREGLHIGEGGVNIYFTADQENVAYLDPLRHQIIRSLWLALYGLDRDEQRLQQQEHDRKMAAFIKSLFNEGETNAYLFQPVNEEGYIILMKEGREIGQVAILPSGQGGIQVVIQRFIPTMEIFQYVLPQKDIQGLTWSDILIDVLDILEQNERGDRDQGMLSNTGGIDLRAQNAPLSVITQGAGAVMRIDRSIIDQIERQGIEGLIPVVLKISPLESTRILFKQ